MRFFLLLCLLPLPAFASQALFDLEKQGTLLRLQGDFEAAGQVQAELLASDELPTGHVFALNTIVTHLTWDETITDMDEALLSHADSILTWCEPRVARDRRDVIANYYCGQASFALSYYNGLRGHYFQAGKQGTRTIEFLENVLAADPGFTDAKMHLGVAYYVADNLPPFIRMFSRLLWFIPSGNSEKSLPYLRDVIQNGDQYPEVARYIFSTLALEGDERLRTEVEENLQYLVDHYPRNPRFQLRLISMQLIQGDYESTLRTATTYLAHSTPPEPELSLMKVWMVRAHMGLGQMSEAMALFEELDPVFRRHQDELPGWSIAWHMLTDGQLHDLANRRPAALERYNRIIRISRATYVSDAIEEAARAGLVTPYRLSSP